ncbi:AAA family ATPase [Empedobacter falsenii]
MELWKLGCRWGSGTPLFYNFIKEKNILIGWVDKDYSLDSHVLVTDGHTVLDIAKVTSSRKSILDYPHLEYKFNELEIPFNNNLFVYDAVFFDILEKDRFTYPLQQGIVKVQGEDYRNKFISLKKKYANSKKMNENINLLKYKKQIILQGPPGTGKTREAKKIACELIKAEYYISKEILTKYIKPGVKIYDENGEIIYEYIQNSYSGKEIKFKDYKSQSLEKQDYINSRSYFNFIKYFNIDINKKIQNPNTYIKSNDAAVNFLIDNVKLKELDLRLTSDFRAKISDHLKIIQFHPSYTYEDFVRGIVSKPNEEGDGIKYEAENKILAEFAKKALDNYLDSSKDSETLSKEYSINQLFDNFIEYIEDEIETNGGFYKLTDNVGLISCDDLDAFRYKGLAEGWLRNGNRMLYTDIIKAFNDGNSTRQDIKQNYNLSGLARQHASYFVRVLNLFQDFVKTNQNSVQNVTKIPLKNYVLIIDEINRANLSSVLGELIYALEYRGDAVESMYEVDGENKLILPPNLYIIGTMNTADRSVGHIDYAIRRRFAFVDVLPNDLSNEEGIDFDSILFHQVASLFDTNLSPEFEKKDVQLGHSYFIDKTAEGGAMHVRLQYEIKPILLEYVRDGVLIGEDIKQKIENLEVSI